MQQDGGRSGSRLPLFGSKSKKAKSRGLSPVQGTEDSAVPGKNAPNQQGQCVLATQGYVPLQASSLGPADVKRENLPMDMATGKQHTAVATTESVRPAHMNQEYTQASTGISTNVRPGCSEKPQASGIKLPQGSKLSLQYIKQKMQLHMYGKQSRHTSGVPMHGRDKLLKNKSSKGKVEVDRNQSDNVGMKPDTMQISNDEKNCQQKISLPQSPVSTGEANKDKNNDSLYYPCDGSYVRAHVFGTSQLTNNQTVDVTRGIDTHSGDFENPRAQKTDDEICSTGSGEVFWPGGHVTLTEGPQRQYPCQMLGNTPDSGSRQGDSHHDMCKSQTTCERESGSGIKYRSPPSPGAHSGMLWSRVPQQNTAISVSRLSGTSTHSDITCSEPNQTIAQTHGSGMISPNVANPYSPNRYNYEVNKGTNLQDTEQTVAGMRARQPSPGIRYASRESIEDEVQMRAEFDAARREMQFRRPSFTSPSCGVRMAELRASKRQAHSRSKSPSPESSIKSPSPQSPCTQSAPVTPTRGLQRTSSSSPHRYTCQYDSKASLSSYGEVFEVQNNRNSCGSQLGTQSLKAVVSEECRSTTGSGTTQAEQVILIPNSNFQSTDITRNTDFKSIPRSAKKWHSLPAEYRDFSVTSGYATVTISPGEQKVAMWKLVSDQGTQTQRPGSMIHTMDRNTRRTHVPKSEHASETVSKSSQSLYKPTKNKSAQEYTKPGVSVPSVGTVSGSVNTSYSMSSDCSVTGKYSQGPQGPRGLLTEKSAPSVRTGGGEKEATPCSDCIEGQSVKKNTCETSKSGRCSDSRWGRLANGKRRSGKKQGDKTLNSDANLAPTKVNRALGTDSVIKRNLVGHAVHVGRKEWGINGSSSESSSTDSDDPASEPSRHSPVRRFRTNSHLNEDTGDKFPYNFGGSRSPSPCSIASLSSRSSQYSSSDEEDEKTTDMSQSQEEQKDISPLRYAGKTAWPTSGRMIPKRQQQDSSANKTTGYSAPKVPQRKRPKAKGVTSPPTSPKVLTKSAVLRVKSPPQSPRVSVKTFTMTPPASPRVTSKPVVAVAMSPPLSPKVGERQRVTSPPTSPTVSAQPPISAKSQPPSQRIPANNNSRFNVHNTAREKPLQPPATAREKSLHPTYRTSSRSQPAAPGIPTRVSSLTSASNKSSKTAVPRKARAVIHGENRKVSLPEEVEAKTANSDNRVSGIKSAVAPVTSSKNPSKVTSKSGIPGVSCSGNYNKSKYNGRDLNAASMAKGQKSGLTKPQGKSARFAVPSRAFDNNSSKTCHQKLESSNASKENSAQVDKETRQNSEEKSALQAPDQVPVSQDICSTDKEKVTDKTSLRSSVSQESVAESQNSDVCERASDTGSGSQVSVSTNTVITIQQTSSRTLPVSNSKSKLGVGKQVYGPRSSLQGRLKTKSGSQSHSNTRESTKAGTCPGGLPSVNQSKNEFRLFSSGVQSANTEKVEVVTIGPKDEEEKLKHIPAGTNEYVHIENTATTESTQADKKPALQQFLSPANGKTAKGDSVPVKKEKLQPSNRQYDVCESGEDDNKSSKTEKSTASVILSSPVSPVSSEKSFKSTGSKTGRSSDFCGKVVPQGQSKSKLRPPGAGASKLAKKDRSPLNGVKGDQRKLTEVRSSPAPELKSVNLSKKDSNSSKMKSATGTSCKKLPTSDIPQESKSSVTGGICNTARQDSGLHNENKVNTASCKTDSQPNLRNVHSHFSMKPPYRTSNAMKYRSLLARPNRFKSAGSKEESGCNEENVKVQTREGAQHCDKTVAVQTTLLDCTSTDARSDLRDGSLNTSLGPSGDYTYQDDGKGLRSFCNRTGALNDPDGITSKGQSSDVNKITPENQSLGSGTEQQRQQGDGKIAKRQTTVNNDERDVLNPLRNVGTSFLEDTKISDECTIQSSGITASHSWPQSQHNESASTQIFSASLSNIPNKRNCLNSEETSQIHEEDAGNTDQATPVVISSYRSIEQTCLESTCVDQDSGWDIEGPCVQTDQHDSNKSPLSEWLFKLPASSDLPPVDGQVMQECQHEQSVNRELSTSLALPVLTQEVRETPDTDNVCCNLTSGLEQAEDVQAHSTAVTNTAERQDRCCKAEAKPEQTGTEVSYSGSLNVKTNKENASISAQLLQHSEEVVTKNSCAGSGNIVAGAIGGDMPKGGDCSKPRPAITVEISPKKCSVPRIGSTCREDDADKFNSITTGEPNTLQNVLTPSDEGQEMLETREAECNRGVPPDCEEPSLGNGPGSQSDQTACGHISSLDALKQKQTGLKELFEGRIGLPSHSDNLHGRPKSHVGSLHDTPVAYVMETELNTSSQKYSCMQASLKFDHLIDRGKDAEADLKDDIDEGFHSVSRGENGSRRELDEVDDVFQGVIGSTASQKTNELGHGEPASSSSSKKVISQKHMDGDIYVLRSTIPNISHTSVKLAPKRLPPDITLKQTLKSDVQKKLNLRADNLSEQGELDESSDSASWVERSDSEETLTASDAGIGTDEESLLSSPIPIFTCALEANLNKEYRFCHDERVSVRSNSPTSQLLLKHGHSLDSSSFNAVTGHESVSQVTLLDDTLKSSFSSDSNLFPQEADEVTKTESEETIIANESDRLTDTTSRDSGSDTDEEKVEALNLKATDLYYDKHVAISESNVQRDVNRMVINVKHRDWESGSCLHSLSSRYESTVSGKVALQSVSDDSACHNMIDSSSCYESNRTTPAKLTRLSSDKKREKCRLPGILPVPTGPLPAKDTKKGSMTSVESPRTPTDGRDYKGSIPEVKVQSVSFETSDQYEDMCDESLESLETSSVCSVEAFSPVAPVKIKYGKSLLPSPESRQSSFNDCFKNETKSTSYLKVPESRLPKFSSMPPRCSETSKKLSENTKLQADSRNEKLSVTNVENNFCSNASSKFYTKDVEQTVQNHKSSKLSHSKPRQLPESKLKYQGLGRFASNSKGRPEQKVSSFTHETVTVEISASKFETCGSGGSSIVTHESKSTVSKLAIPKPVTSKTSGASKIPNTGSPTAGGGASDAPKLPDTSGSNFSYAMDRFFADHSAVQKRHSSSSPGQLSMIPKMGGKQESDAQKQVWRLPTTSSPPKEHAPGEGNPGYQMDSCDKIIG